MLHVRMENIRHCQSNDPTISAPIVCHIVSGEHLNLFAKPGIFVTAASKHKIQGIYPKYGLGVNVFCRCLRQFTAQCRECPCKGRNDTHGPNTLTVSNNRLAISWLLLIDGFVFGLWDGFLLHLHVTLNMTVIPCPKIKNPKNSLDESVIPQQVHMKFRTCNPSKIANYDILERLVCEGV
jgi:hypothetical protein